MSALIELRDLSKRFVTQGITSLRARETLAVDRASLTVPRGAVYGLVGESGSGKTTVARCLLRLERPSGGSIVVDGVPIEGMRGEALRAFRRRVQYVCQDPASSLDPRMRVRESVAEGLRNLRVPARERAERASSLLDTVGVGSALGSRFPHELSGGQRQRAALARALAMDPEVIVLDEPVSSLDVSVQAQIINLLAELRERLSLTYLFISHDLGLVGYFCDMIAVMYRGRVVEVAPAEELISRPVHPYSVRLFLAAPALRASMAGRAAAPAAASVDREAEEAALRRSVLEEVSPGHLVARER
jgi:ABC-type oligopeptide transport system ATPase subunit